jgi:hypothetical protein
VSKPTTYKFGEFIIEVGNGASPEVFGLPCGLTSKSFAGNANTNDTNVPDCDDPDAMAWLERAVVALSRDITGSGVLAKEFLATWDDWWTSGNSKHARITIDPYTWSGSYVLSRFEITGTLGNKVQVNVTMTSDGQVTRGPMIP